MGLKSIFVSLVLLVGQIRFALAEGPAVPAGSAPASSAGAGSAATLPGASGAPPQPGLFGMLMPFLVMFAVVYFLMIRPQQKKMKEQQALLSSLNHGDEVLTNSGILGKVTGIAEKVVTLEIAENVKVKMLKSQVAQVIKGQIKDLA